MKFILIFNVILVGVYILITPYISLAAGLVPCGGEGQKQCQTCHTIILMDNVLDWLIVVLSIVASIIIVYAGVRLVISLGDTSAKEIAKRHISNVIIGYVLLLASWLLVDTVTKFLLSDQNYGTWNQIQCVEQPKPIEAQKEYINLGSLGGGTVGTDCEALPNDQYNCTRAVASCTAVGGTPTIITTSIPHRVDCYYEPGGGYGGTCEIISSGPCSPENLRPYFGDRAEEASRICSMESGGAPIRSGSDLCCGPDRDCSGAPSFSGGYFQINILAHAGRIPNCTPGAFHRNQGQSRAEGECVRRNGSGICTGWSCEITDTDMYNRCMLVTTNSTLNLQIAKQLFDGLGGHFNDWLNSARRCEIPL